MITRRDRFKSKKSKTIIVLDSILVWLDTVWWKYYGPWILLGIVMGTVMALPFWIDLLFTYFK